MITINLPTVITFVTISYHISLSNGYSIGKTNGLSFDPDNFQCKEFIPLCNHALDIIGCLPGNSSNGNSDVSNIRGSVVNSLNHSSADHSNRLAIGCSNYPTEQNNLHDYVGLCICFEPVTIDISNTITKQIITNRIKPELKWILEPYKTGPPFDYDTSFLNICELLLPRLGCREEFIVSTSNSYSDNVINKKNICSCGNMTQSASVIHDLIVGEINEFTLTNLPIFSNPVYLSLPLSIVIILLCGKIGAIIVNYMQLPSIVGFLSAGIIIQNFIDPIILHGIGYPYPSPAAELKVIALVIILIRAGLTVKLNELKENWYSVLVMAIIPYMGEVLALSLALSYHLTDWSVVEIALFASVLAPLGPSVIVVGLLSLVETSKDKTVVKSVEKDNINGVVCSNGSGTSSENDIEEEDAAESVAKDYGFIPKLILMSAPIEAVLSIVLFEILATLLQDSSPLYPWVIHLPLVANCILIPVNIIFSITMGMIVGYCCAQYFLWRRATSQNSSYKYMNKNYQLGYSAADFVFLFLLSCYAMISLCNKQYIQKSSGVLVVFTAAITLAAVLNHLNCTKHSSKTTIDTELSVDPSKLCRDDSLINNNDTMNRYIDNENETLDNSDTKNRSTNKVISTSTRNNILSELSNGFKSIWILAEIFLFTFTGTTLSYDPSNGPLASQRAISQSTIAIFLLIIILGTFGRLIGVALSLLLTRYQLPESILSNNKKYQLLLLLLLNIWIYQLPKATVQATIGSVAYTRRIISGPSGINKGLLISQITIFTILIFAPIGTILTKLVGRKISLYLTQIENDYKMNLENEKSDQKKYNTYDSHNECHSNSVDTIAIDINKNTAYDYNNFGIESNENHNHKDIRTEYSTEVL